MQIFNSIKVGFVLLGQSFWEVLKRPYFFLYPLIPAIMTMFLTWRVLYFGIHINFSSEFLFLFIKNFVTLGATAAFIFHFFNKLEHQETANKTVISRIASILLPILLLVVSTVIITMINNQIFLYTFMNEYLHAFALRKIIPAIWYYLSLYLLVFITIEEKSFMRSFIDAFKCIKSTFLAALIGLLFIWLITNLLTSIAILFIFPGINMTSWAYARVLSATISIVNYAFIILIYRWYKKTNF